MRYGRYILKFLLCIQFVLVIEIQASDVTEGYGATAMHNYF